MKQMRKESKTMKQVNWIKLMNGMNRIERMKRLNRMYRMTRRKGMKRMEGIYNRNDRNEIKKMNDMNGRNNINKTKEMNEINETKRHEEKMSWYEVWKNEWRHPILRWPLEPRPPETVFTREFTRPKLWLFFTAPARELLLLAKDMCMVDMMMPAWWRDCLWTFARHNKN